MPILDVVVPEEIGDAEECVVVTWFKRVGDPVEQDSMLLILQAEKISFEIPAPATGQVVAILAQQGDVVQKGQVLARLEVEAVAAPPPPAEPLARPAAPAREVRASPVAKRLAREHQVDLGQVTGTGEGERITEKDVLAFVASRQAGAPAVTPQPPPGETLPMAGMRAAIARRMSDSLHNAAQLTLHTEADVTELVARRDQLQEQLPVTYTDLIVRACALALRQHPRLNATLDGETIRLLPQINIGLAVALDDGLLVPVIPEADRQSLASLVQTRQRLVERARAGQLSPAEVSGGSFTVTNLGNYEIDAFTPIINPPEAAILGMGRIVEKVVIHQGKIAQRMRLTLSLTFDHRLVDGAPAAAFLQEIKRFLEAPEPLVS